MSDVDGVRPADADESARLSLELAALALEAFETQAEAGDWILRPHPMLDGQTPEQSAKSLSGIQRVKAILAAIKYGGVA